MNRSRAAGVTVVVLLAAASGTAAASGGASARPTASPVVLSAPAATATTAFALPVLSAPVVTTTPATVRHHARHVRAGRHVDRPAPLPPCPNLTPSPQFATPQAAMRYLARAWNHDDYDALCHVTDPDARRMLLAMHHEAVHLRLARCEFQAVGRYGCTFRHDYPRHLHAHGIGHAYLEAAAARGPGWYSTGSVACG